MSQSSITTKGENAATEYIAVRCHPGEILREEFMVPLALSASKVALALRVPAGRISDIIHEKRAITPDTALRLSRYFGTSPSLWLNLQSSYDLRLALAVSGQQIDRDITPMAMSTLA